MCIWVRLICVFLLFNTLLAGCVSLPQTQSLKAYPTTDVEAVEYYTLVGQVKGHLVAGGALLQAGSPRQAAPHFGAPIDSLYRTLNQRTSLAPAFQQSLLNLQDWLAHPVFFKQPRVKEQYQQVMTQFDRSLPLETTPHWQSLLVRLRAIDQLLTLIGQTYEVVESNSLPSVFAYETVYGMSRAIYTDFFQPIVPNLRELDPVRLAQMEAVLSRVLHATPAVTALGRELVDFNQVQRAIDEFATLSQQILSPD